MPLRVPAGDGGSGGDCGGNEKDGGDGEARQHNPPRPEASK